MCNGKIKQLCTAIIIIIIIASVMTLDHFLQGYFFLRERFEAATRRRNLRFAKSFSRASENQS